jgi:hypothetical protein
MKTDNFFPRDGTIDWDKEMNARPFPWEWPMKATCHQRTYGRSWRDE